MINMADKKLSEMENDVIHALQGWDKYSKKYEAHIPKDGTQRHLYNLEIKKMQAGFVPTSHISKVLKTEFGYEERYVSKHMSDAVDDLMKQGKLIETKTDVLEPRIPQDGPDYQLFNSSRRGVRLSYKNP